MRKLELIIKERRLRWLGLGHVFRMEDTRIPRQAIQWELRGYKYKKKPGLPRKNCMDIIRRDLKDMDNWTSPGMKPKKWQQTEQNGVNV